MDNLDKFIESYNVDDWEVETDTGWESIEMIHKTIQYDVWHVETEDFSLECADEHILFDENMNEVYVRDIRPGDYIQTANGIQKVIDVGIEDRPSENMYDLELSDETNHRYYTNGILSHNTTTTALFITWYILFNKEKNVLMLGNILDTTVEIIDKVKSIINGLPFFMKPGIVINNVKSMKFDNGCRIIGRTTTADAGIGLTINLLYMDEFAHVSANKIEGFWKATYPTVSGMPNSRIIISSTPNGMNKFHQIWNAAIDGVEVDGKSKFFPMRVDWWQVPGRDEDWKAEAIAELGSIEMFNQEYGLQFFSGDNLLLNSVDIKKLYNIKTKYVSVTMPEMYLDKQFYKDRMKQHVMTDFSEFLTWHPKFAEANFSKYNTNLKSSKDYFIIGIDTSKGVGKDYHVATIFKVSPMSLNRMLMNRNNINSETDIFSLIQVGLLRINSVNIETFSDIVNALIYDVFNPEYVRIGLELNQYGIVVRNKLENNSRYWDGMILYNKRSESDPTWEPGTDLSSNKKKSAYCEKFQQYIATDRFITTENVTFSELSNFGSNENRTIYRCQVGNDDIAMSCIHASVFMESYQFGEICWELFESIRDKEYLKTLRKDVIEYNLSFRGEASRIRPEDLIILD